MATIEIIVFGIVASGIYGIGLFTAYATKAQDRRYTATIYPWIWYGFSALCSIVMIYGTIRDFDLILLIVGIICCAEGIVYFPIMKKLIAPAKAIQEQEFKFQEILLEEQREKAKPQLENLKYWQAMERKAQYCLRLPKFSKEFKKEAEESGMSPEDFKVWCKDTINKYEALVRNYNEHHIDRWQY